LEDNGFAAGPKDLGGRGSRVGWVGWIVGRQGLEGVVQSAELGSSDWKDCSGEKRNLKGPTGHMNHGWGARIGGVVRSQWVAGHVNPRPVQQELQDSMVTTGVGGNHSPNC
jgi:hypothetical protein